MVLANSPNKEFPEQLSLVQSRQELQALDIQLNYPIQLLQVQNQRVVDAILTELSDKHLEDARAL